MKKKSVSILFMIVVFIMSVQSVNAYELLGGKHSTTSLVYRVNSSVTSTYNTAFVNATSAWAATSTPISFSNTTGTSSVHIFVNGSSFGNTGWNAQCTNYRDFIVFGNYSSSVIDANYTYMDSMSSTLKKGVFGHELGHALGLDHVTDTSQIMSTSAAGRATSVPGSDDIAGVNYLYK